MDELKAFEFISSFYKTKSWNVADEATESLCVWAAQEIETCLFESLKKCETEIDRTREKVTGKGHGVRINRFPPLGGRALVTRPLGPPQSADMEQKQQSDFPSYSSGSRPGPVTPGPGLCTCCAGDREPGSYPVQRTHQHSGGETQSNSLCLQHSQSDIHSSKPHWVKPAASLQRGPKIRKWELLPASGVLETTLSLYDKLFRNTFFQCFRGAWEEKSLVIESNKWCQLPVSTEEQKL